MKGVIVDYLSCSNICHFNLIYNSFQMNVKHSTESVVNATVMKTAFTGQGKYTDAIQLSQRSY
jgi:hypothetical protein